MGSWEYIIIKHPTPGNGYLAGVRGCIRTPGISVSGVVTLQALYPPRPPPATHLSPGSINLYSPWGMEGGPPGGGRGWYRGYGGQGHGTGCIPPWSRPSHTRPTPPPHTLPSLSRVHPQWYWFSLGVEAWGPRGAGRSIGYLFPLEPYIL